ncbi:hypothetical protein FRC07_008743, partial [Ceratobasidium sp. 392]
MPEGRADKSQYHENLGDLLHTRFKQIGALIDLDMAVDHGTAAVLLELDDHPNKPAHLTSLSNSLYSRFEQLANDADLDAAIKHRVAAVKLTPKEHPDRHARLNNLGNFLCARFRQQGKLVDLEAAIKWYAEAVLLVPDEHPIKPACMHNLGGSHHSRFERLGVLTDLDVAIKLGTEAVLLTLDEHPNKPIYLNSLGNSLCARFRRLGGIANLDAAIEHYTAALRLMPEDDPLRPASLSDLGVALHFRFEQLGRPADLTMSIDRLNEAQLLTPDGHQAKPKCLDNLGSSLYLRFEQTGLISDLDAAIELRTEAVRLLSISNHLDRGSYLFNLGTSLRTRFQRLSRIEDLNRAIEYQTEVVQLAHDKHLQQMPAYLYGLGSSLITRFQHLGKLEDIDVAIGRLTDAVISMPDEHPDKPTCLCNLGNSLCIRFLQIGELEDLDAAIVRVREALVLTPERHHAKHTYLQNMGNTLRTRFNRLGKLIDLNLAIEYHAQAMQLVPSGHDSKPALMAALGESYRTRFVQLKQVADSDAAIKYHTEAVLHTSNQHSEKAEYLCNLGISLYTQFALEPKDLNSLNAAIERCTEGTALMPDGHMNKLVQFHNLGVLHRDRFERLGDQNDVLESLQYFKRAALSSSGSTGHKMGSSIAWARISTRYHLSDRLEAYSRVIELISQIAWLGSPVDHRFKHMSTLVIAPTEAAATAIDLSQHNLALEWLEEGRSVVWSQTLQLRTPLDKLYSTDATLAGDLEQVAHQLDSAGLSNTDQINSLDSRPYFEKISRELHSLAMKWDALIGQVRQLPGFERFLLPKRSSELINATCASTVVVINVHETRCDALALRPGSSRVIHIPLLSISHHQCVHMRGRLLAALRGTHNRVGGSRRPVFKSPEVDGVFEDVLTALWVKVVKPILKALNFMDLPKETNELSHVTWCTTGALTFLPLHAAGFYSDPHERVYNYVISSYTPTLSALLTTPLSSTEFGGILAVGQATQTSHAPLPGTITELDKIQNQAGNTVYCTRLAEENATPEAVLSAMQKHSWVHLACHASQNLSDPTA